MDEEGASDTTNLPAEIPGEGTQPDAGAAPSSSRLRRGHYFLILGTVLALAASCFQRPTAEYAAKMRTISSNVQVRLLVGMHSSLVDLGLDSPLLDAIAKAQMQPEALGRLRRVLTPSDRFIYVVGAFEVSGLRAAHALLERLDDELGSRDIEWTPADRTIREVLGKLYRVESALPDELSAPPGSRGSGGVADRVLLLDEAERETLVEELGWSGRLALNPPSEPPRDPERAHLLGGARASFWGLIALASAALAASILGGIGFIVGSILIARGRLRPRLAPSGIAADVPLTVAGYAVAYYGVLAFAGSAALFLSSIVSADLALRVWLGLLLLVQLGPLLFLWTAKRRGIVFGALRREMGWVRGKGFIREVLAGIAGLIALLPLIWLSGLATALLSALQSLMRGVPIGDPGQTPPSPVAGGFGGDAVAWASFFVLACLAAPFVEESLFRGLLYRYFRVSTSRATRVGRVAVSALLSSLVFASLHTQGWVAIPTLTALGVSFCLIREWRDSLIAPMAAHGMWNLFVLLVPLFAFHPVG